MIPTILFGGVNRERLVAVASAQAIAKALPEAELWFWAADGQVSAVSSQHLTGHQRPFELEFSADGERIGPIETALNRARAEGRTLVLAMHGGPAENGELAALCEARGVPFTGSGSAASRIGIDKAKAKSCAAAAGLNIPKTVAPADAAEALAQGRRLVAKPLLDGSSYGLLFIDGPDQLPALREAVEREPYLIEGRVEGAEGTCGVLERDGDVIALPPVEVVPDGAFDYASKYLSAATREICPARFGEEINEALGRAAVTAHKAVGASGYSRSDFFIGADGTLTFIEINTLPGLTAASLYPKSLAVQGIGFRDFLLGQIALAEARAASRAAG
jgi:D-alanine-D-alanine ligase